MLYKKSRTVNKKKKMYILKRFLLFILSFLKPRKMSAECNTVPVKTNFTCQPKQENQRNNKPISRPQYKGIIHYNQTALFFNKEGKLQLRIVDSLTLEEQIAMHKEARKGAGFSKRNPKAKAKALRAKRN